MAKSNKKFTEDDMFFAGATGIFITVVVNLMFGIGHMMYHDITAQSDYWAKCEQYGDLKDINMVPLDCRYLFK